MKSFKRPRACVQPSGSCRSWSCRPGRIERDTRTRSQDDQVILLNQIIEQRRPGLILQSPAGSIQDKLVYALSPAGR